MRLNSRKAMERRSTSTIAMKDVDDAGDSQGNSMGMESLKESLNALLKSDEQLQLQQQEREQEGRQQAQTQDDQPQQAARHQHRRISSGAQRIMDRLASLRTHNINNNEDIDSNSHHKACSPRQELRQNRYDCRSSRSREKTQHNIDNDVASAECCENDLDTSFTTATTTGSSLYSSPSSRLQGGDGIFVVGREGGGGGQKLDHSSSIIMQHEEEQPHPKQQHRPVERRKSIPRHRNSELNSTISSCLKPARYTSSGSGSVNSSNHSNRRNSSSHNGTRSSTLANSVGLANHSCLSQRSFSSSLSSFDIMNDIYNDNCSSNMSLSSSTSVRRNSDASSSWVASGVVIADFSEEIRLRD